MSRNPHQVISTGLTSISTLRRRSLGILNGFRFGLSSAEHVVPPDAQKRRVGQLDPFEIAMARILLIGILLCCYSSAEAQTGACGAIANSAKIAEVGAFSNMRYTDENAHGYSVMLWRVGNCLLGFFESSEGLAGDTPIGELQDVKSDSKTAKLSFSAKLTMGLVSFKGSNSPEPLRDLFTFDGHLKATT